MSYSLGDERCRRQRCAQRYSRSIASANPRCRSNQSGDSEEETSPAKEKFFQDSLRGEARGNSRLCFHDISCGVFEIMVRLPFLDE